MEDENSPCGPAVRCKIRGTSDTHPRLCRTMRSSVEVGVSSPVEQKSKQLVEVQGSSPVYPEIQPGIKSEVSQKLCRRCSNHSMSAIHQRFVRRCECWLSLEVSRRLGRCRNLRSKSRVHWRLAVDVTQDRDGMLDPV